MNEESLISRCDWSFPVPIVYGPGRLQEIGEHAAKLGLTKPLIVTDQGSAGLPFINVLRHLNLQVLLQVWRMLLLKQL